MHCKLSYDANLLEGADHVLLEISLVKKVSLVNWDLAMKSQKNVCGS